MVEFTMTGEVIVQTPPKYADVLEWVTNSLDGIGGNNGKIVLNVNGGAVEAEIETTSIESDDRGRRVKVKRTATTRIALGITLPVRWSKAHR